MKNPNSSTCIFLSLSGFAASESGCGDNLEFIEGETLQIGHEESIRVDEVHNHCIASLLWIPRLVS